MRPLSLPPQPSTRGIVASDLTGGLDFTPTGYGISSNRSTEAVNVNWLVSGGFELRRAVKSFSPTSLPAEVVTMGYLETSTQEFCVVALADGSIWACAGEGQPFTILRTAGPVPCTSMYQVNSSLYMCNGVSDVFIWNGATITTLTEGWNPSPVGSPTAYNDHFPHGKYMVVFGGHMHLAYTNEWGSGEHPNRIRQSLAMVNRTGERDWREDDYFDIDEGKDGQFIVGMATAGQKVFAIRQHSLYQIEGSDYTEYAFPEVSSVRGASGEKAYVSFNDMLWCWDSVYGLHATSGYSDANGSIVREVASGGLIPLLEDGEFINPSTVRLGTDGVRVLVSTDTKTWGRRTFAYDPGIKAWTAWDLKLGPFATYSANGRTETLWLTATSGQAPIRVLRMGVKSASDEMGAGHLPIPVVVRTAWLDDSRPTTRKLGRSVQYVYESGASSTTSVSAYADWGRRELFSSTLAGTAPAEVFELGSSELLATPTERHHPGATPTAVPCPDPPVGTPEVGPVDPPTAVLTQPLTTCAFRSVQLRFQCSAPSEAWRVRAVSLTYQPDARRP